MFSGQLQWLCLIWGCNVFSLILLFRTRKKEKILTLRMKMKKRRRRKKKKKKQRNLTEEEKRESGMLMKRMMMMTDTCFRRKLRMTFLVWLSCTELSVKFERSFLLASIWKCLWCETSPEHTCDCLILNVPECWSCYSKLTPVLLRISLG